MENHGAVKSSSGGKSYMGEKEEEMELQLRCWT
jgi:hypothetical protein